MNPRMRRRFPDNILSPQNTRRQHMRKSSRGWTMHFSSLCLLALLTGVGQGANCERTSVGLVPLDDLGPRMFMGYQGGLYPEGNNQRPDAHEAAGVNLAGQ